jgi:hypothetical protein
MSSIPDEIQNLQLRILELEKQKKKMMKIIKKYQ